MWVENHSQICHIMLYHFEKGWKAAQSFRDVNELFGKGTVSVGGGLSVSNQRNEQTPFLKNLVTGDESWFFFNYFKRKKVYVSPDVSTKEIPKHVHCKKAMWCVWWDRSARGIDCLPSKREAVIEVDGDYAPE
ncbi:hypothetical protein TNCV_4028751 [Trichonephila clavipes]|nr:hypothetical protein TNCV_4028751 [Trichonephila clavipes]